MKGGSDADQVLGGDAGDRVSGNRGPDLVYGNDGPDSIFGGWGADRAFGGSGDDELHALAADNDPDLLNCGPGDDKAFVLRSERPSTTLVGCETLLIVVELSADQEEGENSDADTEADG